ncbi:ADP-ribosylation factor-like protein 2-binding protein [Geranomyces michiganensis]|nr:ADP-ribosylation factor-like protein 2-binding protein [Geranomyces michiganensis]
MAAMALQHHDVDLPLDDQVDEDLARATKSSAEDNKFDAVVGELEDMLMDPYFIKLHDTYLADHCAEFSDNEENKLIYTEIFHDYVNLIEKFIDKRLKARLEWFSMPTFLQMLKTRKDSLEGDVFDVLSSLADFDAFKDLMLSYKQEQEGTSIDLSGLLAVHGAAGH